MVKNQAVALTGALFVVLWVVLWASTFDLHLRLDQDLSFVARDAHRPSSPDDHARLALQDRIQAIEKKLVAAEDELEDLVAAAAARHSKIPAAEGAVPVSATPPISVTASLGKTADVPRDAAAQVPAAALVLAESSSAVAAAVDRVPIGGSFVGHPILAMDDETFRATPVHELMAQYGKAGGDSNCEGDFGTALINRWRDAGNSYCGARSDSSSSIRCHHIKQTRHHGNGDQLCEGRNLRLDTRDFSDETVTRAVLKSYIDTKHMDAAYIHYRQGTLAGTCNLDRSLWRSDNFPGWNEDWQKAFVELPGNSDSELQCDLWVEEPTLVLQRDTFANFFHDSEDFFNTFIALAVLKWNTRDLQIILADLYPKGPFWDLWSRVFKGKHDPLTAWDLKTKFGNRKVCYRRLATSIYGPASPITVASWRTPCFHTPLVRAYADFVIRGLQLHGATHYAQPRPPQTVMITWMARRASSQWPERRFCDSANSFFKCEDWQHLDKRSLGRMVRNDKEVVSALKQLETRTFGNNAQVQFRDVDFNLLTFEEQIQVDVTTDIMIGPHGAGLMHNIFMPDRAVLIELHIDGSGANQHFHNLARWQGRKYIAKSMGNPIGVGDLERTVVGAIESMDISSY